MINNLYVLFFNVFFLCIKKTHQTSRCNDTTIIKNKFLLDSSVNLTLLIVFFYYFFYNSRVWFKFWWTRGLDFYIFFFIDLIGVRLASSIDSEKKNQNHLIKTGYRFAITVFKELMYIRNNLQNSTKSIFIH